MHFIRDNVHEYQQLRRHSS